MKRVVYTCPYIPAEWLRAHGVVPSRIAPGPAPAGAAPRSGVCPYAWCFLQSVLADKSAGGAVFTTRCDQMRRLYEYAARDASVQIYDLSGRLVRAIPLGRLETGERVVRWDGRDDAGSESPAGVYFARVSGVPEVASIRTKVVLIR